MTGAPPVVAPRWEIGGDFETVTPDLLGHHRLGAQRTPPWVGADDDRRYRYVESGRQALAVVEAALRASGFTRLLVPEYLCDSMVQPFAVAGWQLVPVPVDADLQVVPAGVAAALGPARTTAVLHAAYFGRPTPAALRAQLRVAQDHGAVVVADETHLALAPEHGIADIRMASLRKLLPVADGAYVRLPPELEPPTGVVDVQSGMSAAAPEDNGVTRIRTAAMVAKVGHLGGDGKDRAHLPLFTAAEELVETRTAPRPMSRASRRLLAQLDLATVARRRQDNAAALAGALTGVPGCRVVTPPTAGSVPSHLLLQVEDAPALQRALAATGVFCPRHWPPSELVPQRRPWPTCYLSVPVDQRYEPADMMCVARLIAGALIHPAGGDPR
ncbi:hypothetical protein [Modestobacter sp. KNN46-3]|jgi:hypothetical protein|uniref:hypothetical protein n=1 Tax=Modestobacter sp. KNN46-3 TaxID=2711218 RepID=UPI0013DF134A|nr:hypothetical protein [Modestobacter sp. KNN46-3]